MKPFHWDYIGLRNTLSRLWVLNLAIKQAYQTYLGFNK